MPTFESATQQSQVTSASENLSGSVERITYHSEENGFCVLRVKVRGHLDLVTVTGNAASISPGEYIECQGNWFNDKNYGLQFKSQRLNIVPPSTLEGIEKYLGSGMIEGHRTSFCEEACEGIRRAGIRCNRRNARQNAGTSRHWS